MEHKIHTGIPCLEPGVGDEIGEVIHEILSDEDTKLWFPFVWVVHDGVGGPAVDPLEIYLDLACGTIEDKSDSGNQPQYRSNLRDILSPEIEMCTNDGSFSLGLSHISTALRSLADEIDKAVSVATAKGKMEILDDYKRWQNKP